MSLLNDNLEVVKKQIEVSCDKAQRSVEDVILIGVTKTVDIDVVSEAIKCGITHAGENKPQELARKYEVIGDDIKWHQIGTLQTNKVKYIIDKVHMIHSLDRHQLCEEIQKRSENINKVTDCLVQVNISNEETKHGLKEDEVIDFVKEVSKQYKNIRIKGLMTMAPFDATKDEIRAVFRGLKNLSLQIQHLNIENVDMKHLSMGMSNDFDIAIEEGATMVRVGTSIFGERNYSKK